MTTIYKLDETQTNTYVDLTNGDAIVYLKQFTIPGKSYTVEDVLGKASPTHSIYILATEGTVFSDGTYSIVLSVPYTSIRLNTLSPNIWQVTSIEVKPIPQPGSVLQVPSIQSVNAFDNQIQYNTSITYTTNTFSEAYSTLRVSSLASFSSFSAKSGDVVGQFTAASFSTLANASIAGSLTATSFSTLANASIAGSLTATSFSTLANASIAGSLTATSFSTLANASIAGSLTAASFSTLTNASIAGSLTAASFSTVGNASIHGDLYVKGVLYTPGGGGGGAVTNNTYITNPVVSTCSTLAVSSVAYFSSFGATTGSVLGQLTTASLSTLADTCIGGTLFISKSIQEQRSLIKQWVAVGQDTNTILTSPDGFTWTPVTGTSFTGSGNGLAWNGSLWVAVGSGINTILTSPDGSTWSAITGTTFSNGSGAGSSVAWNGSLWVAVGSGTNTILTSPDGSTWSAVTGTTFSDGSGAGMFVAWNGSLWVAVGSGTNTILTSRDGSTWTAATGSSFSTGGGFGMSVAWNGFLWVAIGSGTNTILTSRDGITWSSTGISGDTFSGGYGKGIAWNGSLWVAVGYGSANGINTILYSSDGFLWKAATGTMFTIYGRHVTWNGSMWIAIGAGTNTILYSYNGTTWSASGVTGAFTENSYGKASAYTTPLQPFLTTKNLAIYSQGNPSFLTSTCKILATSDSIVLNDSLFVNMSTNSVGVNINPIDSMNSFVVNGSCAVSEELTTTSFSTIGNASIQGDLYVKGVLYTPGGSGGSGVSGVSVVSDIATYSTVIISSIATFSSFTTTSGKVSGEFVTSTFSTLGSASIGNGILNISKKNDTQLVAVGSGTNTIKYSKDGKRWSNVTTNDFTTAGYGVASNGTLWVAVGSDASGNTIKTSTDGISWSNISGRFPPGTSYGGRGIATTGTLWVAVGSDPSGNTIQYSYDGITWGNSSSTNRFPANADDKGGRGVTTNGTWWVAVGVDPTTVNTIKTSRDGITWTNAISGGFSGGISYGGYDVATNGIRWVAVGSDPSGNTIQYSYDGSVWSPVSVGFSSGDTFGGRGVATNGVAWVAVGYDTSGNTIKYSLDGIIWTSATGGFSVGGRSVTWDGSQWIAVGEDASGANTIKTSPDGILWTNSSSGAFEGTTSGIGYGIAWNGKGDTSSVSVDTAVTVNGTLTASTFSTTGTASIGDGLLTVSKKNKKIFFGMNSSDTSSNNVLKYSYDRIVWNKIETSVNGFNKTGYGIATNGKIWIAVGISSPSQSTIKYSTDSYNWKDCVSGGFSEQSGGRGIATNGTRWVAVGGYYTGQSGTSQSDTIQYSDDGGVTWKKCVSGGFSPQSTTQYEGGYAVATNGTRWVAVGTHSSSAGTIQYSDDGLTWTNCSTVSPSSGFPESGVYTGGSTGSGGRGVATNGARWVAVGVGVYENYYSYQYNINNWYSGTIKFSDDNGVSWSSVGGGFLKGNGYSVATNGTRWVAVGYDTSGNTIQYSDNGIVWNIATGGFSSQYGGRGIATNGKQWVAVGSDSSKLGSIKYSYDGGVTWNNCRSGGFDTGGGGSSVTWDGSKWIAVGYSYYLSDSILFSYNGLDWYRSINRPFSLINNMVTNGRRWVAVGALYHWDYNDGMPYVGRIYYSDDGFRWNRAILPDDGNTNLRGALDVATNGTRWVAVGDTSSGSFYTIKYSDDGINWKICELGGFENGIAIGGRGVATNGTRWVAVGYSSYISARTIQYSDDGIKWYDCIVGGFSISSYYWEGPTGVATNGTRWVAVSSRSTTLAKAVQYSNDGIRWYNCKGDIESGHFSIATNGSRWVTVASVYVTSSSIMYSDDGINWTSASGGFNYVGSKVIWDGSQWFAFGTNKKPDNTYVKIIKTSPDGKVWTDSSIDPSIENIVSNGKSGETSSVDVDGTLTATSFSVGTLTTTSFSTLANASIAGTLTATSFSTLANASIAGTLIVSSFSTLANAEIAGTLAVNGTAKAFSFITSSDERLKTNVQSIENALDKINRLRGVYYTYVKQPMYRSLGVIAQEVEQVVPEVVHTETSIQAYKSVEYGNLAGLFIEGFKTVTVELQTLKAELSTMKGPC